VPRSVWRGQVMGQADEAVAAHPGTRRLQCHRLESVECRIDAVMQTGGHEERGVESVEAVESDECVRCLRCRARWNQHEALGEDGRAAPEGRIKDWDRGRPRHLSPSVDLRRLGSESTWDPNASIARHMTVSAMRFPATPSPIMNSCNR